jgi:outer membrane protein assembly factor BamA
VGKLDQDNRTGNVSLRVDVTQGPKFVVRSVRQEVYFVNSNAPPTNLRTNWLFHTYSTWWEQDFTHSLKTNYYTLGYPGTAVALKIEQREPIGTNVFLDIMARIDTGPRVRTGDVSFQGEKHTKVSLLERRVPLKTGEWLNRLDAERGQYRLARLGVFDTVELNYQTVSSNLWDVRYDLKEGKRLEVSPIFGFGTYDGLRGGVEVDQYNLWGLAHNDQIKLIQSFKSSSVDYTYIVPQVFGKDVDVFATGNYLRRQEISFLRVEYGGGLGGRKYFRDIATDLSLRYNYGLLQATDINTNLASQGLLNPTVGEFILDVRHDRRDNPLDPRHGYQLLANAEVASEALGGNANFERAELGASYHITLGDSQWLHLGLRHGFVFTPDSVSNNLPFVRRFFPGGEDSVRGYEQGEAAPRDAQGRIVGAETYTGGNVEFEQGITPKWSIVGFLDWVEFAQSIDHYPGDTALFSAGGGIRWHTIIGPVRLEYGQNLNPRPRDPSGTIQFSLGFPF